METLTPPAPGRRAVKIPSAARQPREKYRGYTPKRVDRNQPEIVSFLRRLGFAVELLHETGRGVFDTLCAKSWFVVSVEIKDGLKAPSAREFTPKQRKWNFMWPGAKCVVTCERDCLRLNDSVNLFLRRARELGLEPKIEGNPELQYQPGLY